MVEVRVVIPAPGLHARPAALIVQQAGRYASQVTLLSAGKSASARSVLGLMALGLGPGAEVVVRAEGADEAVAAAEVAAAVVAAVTGGAST